MPHPSNREPHLRPEAPACARAQEDAAGAAIDPTKIVHWIRLNDGRTYMATVSLDLFGQPTVITSWGSIHRAGGGAQIVPFDTLEAAVDHLTRVAHRRQLHGYALL